MPLPEQCGNPVGAATEFLRAGEGGAGRELPAGAPHWAETRTPA